MFKLVLASSLINFITKIFTSLLILFVQILITRYYAPSELGHFSKLINYANISTVAVGLGLNISSIYFIRKNKIDQFEVFVLNYITYIALSTILLITLLVIDYDVLSAVIISLFALFNNMYFLHNSIAQANTDFKKFNIQNLLYSGINLIAVILIIIFHNRIKVNQILFLQIFYLFICVTIFFKREWILKLSTLNKICKVKIANFYSYGTQIFILNFLGILLYSGDIILLDYFVENESLAVYLVAATGIKVLWIGIDSIGVVLFPEFINTPSNDQNALNRVLLKIIIILSCLVIASFIGFYYVGKPMITELYGSEFLGAYDIILILIIATLGVIFYKFLSRLFAASEKWAPIYLSLVVGITVNWVFNYLYIEEFGIITAAYSSLIAYLVTGVLITIFYIMHYRKSNNSIMKLNEYN